MSEMKQTTALIVEDEQKSADVLQKLIERHCPNVNIVGVAGGVNEGLELIRTKKPQLVFLDIEMHDGTGFDLLQKVDSKSFDVIFTTAYIQYAIKAIRFSAMDYILKPIDADELTEAIDRCTQRKVHAVSDERFNTLLANLGNESKMKKIVIPEGDGMTFVGLSDIIRCESDGNYTFIIMTGGKRILAAKTLGDYEEMLSDENFVRIHRSHLINLEHVNRYIKGEGGYVVMSDGSEVEVSRRKKAEFIERISQ
ncbi:MAG: response regulator transcription factor [Flavobacteriales bacterium]|nr:response regulator transcription factor [Flavobacteriales bacterium]